MTGALCLVLGVFSFVLKRGVLNPILSNPHPRQGHKGGSLFLSVIRFLSSLFWMFMAPSALVS